MNNIKHIVVVTLLTVSSAAFGASGVSFEYGESSRSSHSDVNMYRIGAQWDWGKRWFDTGTWSLGGYWDFAVGYWDNNSVGKTNSGLAEIAVTPVFRWQQNRPQGFSPYVEAAIGIHFLSKTSVSNERQFGTSFQFGDHLGVGVRVGDRGQYDIGYRYQHLSNAGIKDPNQGINFNQLRLQYHF